MMQLGITLTYSDLFDGTVPDVHDLLKNISSTQIITMLSIVNAQVYLDPDPQFKLLGLLLQNQPAQIRDDITKRIAIVKVKHRDTPVEIFSTQYGLEFLHYELTNFRTIKSEESVESELAFFKAYLIFARNVLERNHDLPSEDSNDPDPFQIQLWPRMVDQFLINHALNPVTEIPKSIAFLNYLQYHSDNAKYVEKFLEIQGKATSWNYILDIINLIASGWHSNAEDPQKPYPFVIKINPDFKSLLTNFTVDIEFYKTKYGSFKSSYTGMKERPLFKISEDQVVVLSWNFLAIKIYEGLVFDFLNMSGIKEKYPTFERYTQFISGDFIERFLFQRIIRGLFEDKRTVVLFDNQETQGFPDAYVRSGKYVFLFEIKNALFPTTAIDAGKYELIKKVVDDKYNKDDKGTGQLISQLKRLASSGFEEKSFDDLKLKRRNLIIYPIMVYTDRHFGMPGFNRYLMKEFSDRLEEIDLKDSFKAIRPVSFISLSFLLDNIDILRNKTTSLQVAIDQYHDFHNQAAKQFRKKSTANNSFKINETTETVFSKKNRSQIDRKDRNYIETVVNLLDLTEFLPK